MTMKMNGTVVKREGIDKNYLSVREKKAPLFERDQHKREGNIFPERDGLI
jgi:hypothetical protein